MGIIKANEIIRLLRRNRFRWDLKITNLTNSTVYIYHERQGLIDNRGGFPIKMFGIFEIEGGIGCYKGQVWALADADSDVRVWESSSALNTLSYGMLEVPIYGQENFDK